MIGCKIKRKRNGTNEDIGISRKRRKIEMWYQEEGEKRHRLRERKEEIRRKKSQWRKEEKNFKETTKAYGEGCRERKKGRISSRTGKTDEGKMKEKWEAFWEERMK